MSTSVSEFCYQCLFLLNLKLKDVNFLIYVKLRELTLPVKKHKGPGHQSGLGDWSEASWSRDGHNVTDITSDL